MNRTVPSVDEYWDFVAVASRGIGDDEEQWAEFLPRTIITALGYDPWRLRLACERAAGGDAAARVLADGLAFPLAAVALCDNAGLGGAWLDTEWNWYLKAR